MSIAELKFKVIEKVTKIDDENTLMLILEQLKKVENSEQKTHNLSQHFDSVSERYDTTLKKLAQ